MAAVAVFAKTVVPGRVKTRLARDIGAEPAACFADAFLRDTWSTISAHPIAHPVLASEDGVRLPAVGAEATVVDQGNGSLGERLERVAAELLRRHAHVLLLGADTPHVPLAYIDALLGQLKHVDASLGPAEDGGFWGLAMRRCPTGCLGGIQWSVDSTARQTLESLAAGGLSIGIGPSWYDVDELPALTRMLRGCAQDALPATRKAARRFREVVDGA